jgi:hypothetical protein
MCDPITISAAIGVVSAAASGVAQIKSAKAQTKAIRAQQAVVREENRQVATAETFDLMRASRREQAKIRTTAGEAGLALNSGSVEALLRDSAMQGELARDRVLANLESRHSAATAEASSALSRIQKPTALGVGLNIAAAGAEGWANIDAAKLKKAQPPSAS